MTETARNSNAIADGALTAKRWRGAVRSFESGSPWLVAGVALSLLAFGRIAFWMVDGDAALFDEQLILALRAPGNPADPIGPAWLEGFMRDVTGLGGFGILSFLVLSVSGFLASTGSRREAAEIFVVSLSGWLMSHLMKFAFARPRPDLVPHGADVFSSSFPSGHAMVSAVVYLTLGAVLSRATDDLRVKAFVLVLAVVLTVAIGFSRVYLGVHWPTDVLAGWSLGAAWVGLSWIAIRRFSRAN